jgi:hypothetical protein
VAEAVGIDRAPVFGAPGIIQPFHPYCQITPNGVQSLTPNNLQSDEFGVTGRIIWRIIGKIIWRKLRFLFPVCS